MTIDAHTHVGFGDAIDRPPDELAASMRRARIAQAMVFAGAINACSTERLLEALAPYRGTMHAIGSVSPGRRGAYKPSVAKVDKWLASGAIRGLKFYTGYEHFFPNDRRLRPYLKLLVKHERPAIFHSGDTYNVVKGAKLRYAHPLAIDDLAAEMPDLRIIIAHLGSPWVLDAAEVCYKNENVHADCSGFVYDGFDAKSRRTFAKAWKTFLETAGSGKKILFGSDWPISDQRSYVKTVEEMSGKDKRLVMAGNAERLFGLSEPAE